MELSIDKNLLTTLFGNEPNQINSSTYVYEKINNQGYRLLLQIDFSKATIFFELTTEMLPLPFYKVTIENVSSVEIMKNKLSRLIIKQKTSDQICQIYFPSFYYTVDDEEGFKTRTPYIEEALLQPKSNFNL